VFTNKTVFLVAEQDITSLCVYYDLYSLNG